MLEVVIVVVVVINIYISLFNKHVDSSLHGSKGHESTRSHQHKWRMEKDAMLGRKRTVPCSSPAKCQVTDPQWIAQYVATSPLLDSWNHHNHQSFWVPESFQPGQ